MQNQYIPNYLPEEQYSDADAPQDDGYDDYERLNELIEAHHARDDENHEPVEVSDEILDSYESELIPADSFEEADIDDFGAEEPQADISLSASEDSKQLSLSLGLAAEPAETAEIYDSRNFTAVTLALCLKQIGVQLKQNVRDGRTYIGELTSAGTEWIEACDDDINATWDAIKQHCKAVRTTKDGSLQEVAITASPQDRTDSMAAYLRDRRFDPVADYVNSLPAKCNANHVCIDISRVIESAFELKNTEDIELIRHASQAIFTTVIARLLKPAKHDEMLVLRGGQNVGKSTFCEMLLPEELGDYYSDSLDWQADYRTQVENIRGKVIVEAKEMVGGSRADVERIKSFIDKTSHYLALKYEKLAKRILIQYSVIGTMNQASLLPNDPTGNRRFILADIARSRFDDYADYKAWLADHRDCWWAQAKAAVGQNASCHELPGSLRAMQEAANESVRGKNDILEEAIMSAARQVDILTSKAIRDYLVDKDIDCGYSRTDEKPTARAIANTLISNGYSQGKQTRLADGSRARIWSKES